MTASIGILNVGAGDTKLIFDKSNPAESIRAARIVADMLRRGYALLVEVTMPSGEKKFQRVTEFREDSQEYIIADFDPVTAEKADKEEAAANEHATESAAAPSDGAPSQKDRTAPKRRPRRVIPASEARGVAIARTAGG